MLKVMVCLGLAMVGMVGLVHFMVDIGVPTFDFWGSIAIIVYSILAVSTIVCVINDDVENGLWLWNRRSR